MLNISICQNRSGNVASKRFNACYTSGLPYLGLDGDRSIGNGNSLSIATTYQAMSVPSTEPSFQAYSAKTTPCYHC